MDREETFQKIKNRFRIYQVGKHFYAQEKRWFGWSYNNKAEYNADDSNLLIYNFVVTSLLGATGIIFFLVSLFSNEPPPFLVSIILLSSALLNFIVVLMIELKNKNLSVRENNLKYLENKIDYIVSKRVEKKVDTYNKKQEKLNKKLEKKLERQDPNIIRSYHYFYDDKKMRAEKLKRLSKSKLKINVS